jgi:hypothetical protein
LPGGDELVGGAAEGDRIAARERARLHERRDDHVLDAILCLLQGHPGRRRHLHRDHTLPLAVEDLLGAAGKLANLRHALQRHELAAGRNHRQRAHVLRALHEPFISLDDEVDAIAAEVMVGGVAAIDEAVDHVAELPGVERHVGRLLQPRHELDLGAREIERRLRQVLAARGRLRQLAHDLHAELYFLLFSGRDHDRRGGGGAAAAAGVPGGVVKSRGARPANHGTKKRWMARGITPLCIPSRVTETGGRCCFQPAFSSRLTPTQGFANFS